VDDIREFAMAKGTPIVYLPSSPCGGVRVREASVGALLVMTRVAPFDAYYICFPDSHRQALSPFKDPRVIRVFGSIKHH